MKNPPETPRHAPRPPHRRRRFPGAERLATTARSLAVVRDGQGDTVPAIRIALSVGVPLTLLLLTGHTSWGLFAAFGAFASIYGKYAPTTERLRQQGIAGAMLVVLVTSAAWLASVGDGLGSAPKAWIVVVWGAACAGLASAGVVLWRLRPRGVVFFVFAAAGVASAHAVAPAWVALVVAGLSVLWSLLLGLLFHRLGEANADGPVPERAPMTRTEIGRDMARFAAAALISGAIATAAAIPSPYWAQVAAVVPLSETSRRHQVERGLHRIIGTGLGIVVAAFLFSFPLQAWQVVVWVVILQFLAEMFVIRNYSLGLVFITPLALMMVHLGSPGADYAMLIPRLLETAIGAVVGLAMVVTGLILDRRWRARRVS